LDQDLLKVGVIGAGYFAQLQIEAWRRIDGVDLVAVCDQDELRARQAAEAGANTRSYTDVHHMLDREALDIIDIATPPESHLQLVQTSAAQSRFVICQKPLAPTIDEAVELVTSAQTHDCTLVVHENVRFMPWHRQMRHLIDDGQIGDLLGISMRLRPGDGQGVDAYLDRQPYFQSMERFLVHETAIHWIDTFRYLAGEPSGVFARLQKLNPVIAGEDCGLIVFDMVNGSRAVFDGNRLVDHDTDNPRRTMGEMLVEGSTGCIRLDGRGRLYIRNAGESEIEFDYQWKDQNFGGDCVFALQSHVCAHLLHGKALENTGAEYLRNIEIEEKIYQSAAEQRWLSL